MIFPIGDENYDRRVIPFVNYALIIVNILVFVFLQQLGSDVTFTYSYATVPEEIVTGSDRVTEDRVLEDPASGGRFLMPGLQPTPVSVYLTLITSMFLHGGLAHILGNMLYLWIFGDNLEDRMGHFRYLLFYLVCGVLASLAHVYSSLALGANLLVPSLGASGAISGVLGGYILLFPRRRVRVFIFRILLSVPAVVAIGIWIVFQLVSGMGVLGSGSQEGGVAYAAHIGGFFAGLVLVKLFDRGDASRAQSRRRVR